MYSKERISIVNGYGKDAYTYVPVVIIGAGLSGIAMACQLKEQLGFDQFRLYDRQAGLGGTWWINRYPGVACDVPTPLYSFSFHPNKYASNLNPTGPELIKYVQHVAAAYGIIDKISLNTDIVETRWLETEKQWQVVLQHLAPGTGDLSRTEREQLVKEKGRDAVYLSTEVIRAKAVISACGGLVEPRDLPASVEGWDNFDGDIMHTARWKRDLDFRGKDVVVVGSGCSAAQTVPNLIKEPYYVNSVTQIMRSAPWVDVKPDEPGGKESYAKWAPWLYQNIPGFFNVVRWSIAAGQEVLFLSIFGVDDKSRANREKKEVFLVERLKRLAPEAYHKMLTPDFDLGCKRRIFDASWYKALRDPKVRLSTQKLVRVGKNSVHLAGGGEFPEREDDPTGQTDVEIKADVIIMANGFGTTEWLHPLKVVGRGDANLADVWHARGGAQAYMGTAMDGFPNFFMLFGPNMATGHTSVLVTAENQVNYSIKLLRKVLSGDAETVEVKKEAEVKWTSDIQRELNQTVFNAGGCTNWYVDQKTGWNSTTYPRSQWEFQYRCMFPRWADWNVTLTSKGAFRRRIGQFVRVTALIALLVGVQRLRARGVSLLALPSVLGQTLKFSAVSLLGLLGARIGDLQETLLAA